MAKQAKQKEGPAKKFAPLVYVADGDIYWFESPEDLMANVHERPDGTLTGVYRLERVVRLSRTVKVSETATTNPPKRGKG